MNATPLRYPGGKSLMTKFFEEVIETNSMKNVVYAEPYAGGAGAAINLLLNKKVDSIKINDANIGIYSFWYFLINESEKFLRKFNRTEVSLKQWQKQRKIVKTATEPSLKLAFATFFLSRCNRSGIINAGPMGGQDPFLQINATYKLDCRYNKKELKNKLKQIIDNKEKICVYNDDALKFLKRFRKKAENILVYLDPPYYIQGAKLYMNYYKHADHAKLAEFLKKSDKFKWILSYDNVEQIRDLYSDCNLYKFNLKYSAQKTKKGVELLTHSKNLILPKPLEIKRKSKNIPIKSILK